VKLSNVAASSSRDRCGYLMPSMKREVAQRMKALDDGLAETAV
jgi:hypothetical protein